MGRDTLKKKYYNNQIPVKGAKYLCTTLLPKQLGIQWIQYDKNQYCNGNKLRDKRNEKGRHAPNERNREINFSYWVLRFM